ncbi:MAG: hypothetical protein AAF517_17025, partial [Planctomycetota bacterium]
ERETDRTLELRTEREKLVIDRKEILSIDRTKNSMMPERLLSGLTIRETRDLFKYLMSERAPAE